MANNCNGCVFQDFSIPPEHTPCDTCRGIPPSNHTRIVRPYKRDNLQREKASISNRVRRKDNG